MLYRVKKIFSRKGQVLSEGAEIECSEREAVQLWMGGYIAPVFPAKPAPVRRSRRTAAITETRLATIKASLSAELAAGEGASAPEPIKAHGRVGEPKRG
ncbi:MAG: hypothetical protein ACFCUG_02780 [Thiotrichales bacterium]